MQRRHIGLLLFPCRDQTYFTLTCLPTYNSYTLDVSTFPLYNTLMLI
jgi:hypothetical protein